MNNYRIFNQRAIDYQQKEKTGWGEMFCLHSKSQSLDEESLFCIANSKELCRQHAALLYNKDLEISIIPIITRGTRYTKKQNRRAALLFIVEYVADCEKKYVCFTERKDAEMFSEEIKSASVLSSIQCADFFELYDDMNNLLSMQHQDLYAISFVVIDNKKIMGFKKFCDAIEYCHQEKIDEDFIAMRYIYNEIKNNEIISDDDVYVIEYLDAEEENPIDCIIFDESNVHKRLEFLSKKGITAIANKMKVADLLK